MKTINHIDWDISDYTIFDWHDLYIEHARGQRHDILPFPEDHIQQRTKDRGYLSNLENIMEGLKKLKPPSHKQKVLDFGCGWGGLTRLLPFYYGLDNVFGADSDTKMIESAHEMVPQFHHHLLENEEKLPFVDDIFDVIITRVGSPVMKEKGLLGPFIELARVLKKDGVLIVADPENLTTDFYTNFDLKFDALRISKKLSLETMNFKELDADEWRQIYMDHAEGVRGDLIPFPSPDIQTATNSKKGRVTALDAISILDCILESVDGILDLKEDKHILDYGCGWGRMTRLLPYFVNHKNIVGVDVDDRLIASANELVPEIPHKVVKSMEPLPFEDCTFDLIYANSVFSHLSQRSFKYTLGELTRILNKNGVVVISVLEKQNMDVFYDGVNADWIESVLGDRQQAEAQLKKEGVIWGDTGRWHEYGIMILEKPWAAEQFAQLGLKLMRANRRDNHKSQTYLVGQKI